MENMGEQKPEMSSLAPHPEMHIPVSVGADHDSSGSGKGKKVIAIIAVLLVVLGAAAGGVWAYMTYFAMTPEKLVDRMVESLGNVETMKYGMTFETTVTGFGLEDGKKQKISITASGATTVANTTLPQSWYMMGLSNEGNNIGAYEFRRIDDKGYFKLQSLSIPGFDIGAPLPWVRISVEEVRALAEELGAPQDVTAQLEANESLTEDKLQAKYPELRDAFLKSGAMKVEGEVAKETIDGVALYRIPFVIDADGIARFYNEAVVILEVPVEDRMDIDEDLLADWRKALANITSSVVWVGMKDTLPYVFEMKMLDKEDEDASEVSMRATFGYNEPVNVVAPTDSISLQEAYMQMMQRLMGGFESGIEQESFTPQSDSGISPESAASIGLGSGADADKDGLTYEQEVTIYKTNPNKADTDGDGFLDGDEVKNGYNPLGEGKLVQ